MEADQAQLDVVRRVVSSFVVYAPDELLGPAPVLSGESCWTLLGNEAMEGLRSAIRAASLPLTLINAAVLRRRFDAFLTAERIRARMHITSGQGLDDSLLAMARRNAEKHLHEFLGSSEGKEALTDQVISELDHNLKSAEVASAATELLVQTVISTWSVFEAFARSFVVAWLNADARRSTSLTASLDLKGFFGKPVVDLQTIDEHGFDLSQSMGTVLLQGKRLDSLAVIRGCMAALLPGSKVSEALGDDLWLLNQQRHLLVHRRGWVDAEYISRTGSSAELGKRLAISSSDVVKHYSTVRMAVDAIVVEANMGDADCGPGGAG